MEQLDFSGNTALLALIASLMPLMSFIIILAGKKGKGAGIALFNISLAFVFSLFLFFRIWNDQTVHEQTSWFIVGSIEFKAGILLNNLSVIMMTLVSGISLLVHIYSLSYMKNDPNIHRYWAYLGLFCFSMLGLVISDSLLLVYVFWELVGFSSFLLIGFWFTKHAASQAAKKAFIINRIGDLGFLTGIMIIYSQFNTLDLALLFGENGLVNTSFIKEGIWINGSEQMPAIWLSIAGIAFFLGAMAKSAQFPLHTWLPDAMEGPTSVSSLIHAATMVAAGVFLIARIYPVFDPLVLNIMVPIGVITAFMAATIALTQNDIKRILAYSTISQLGFMIMALGIGAYTESIFHLVTHGFFKCLLFLAAGAVIHQLNHYRDQSGLNFDHQDIRLMGGLRKLMPVTFVTMCIASAALIGLPLSSGYLSKDALLVTTFEWSETQTGIFRLFSYLMVLTSWLTAFYISRLIFKVFFGKAKDTGPVLSSQINDAAAPMTYILLILAFFCLFIPFSIDPLLFDNSWLLSGFFLNNVQSVDLFHWLVPLTSNLGSAVMVVMAYLIYVKGEGRIFSDSSFFYRFSKREWYFNEVYSFTLVRPAEKISRLCYTFDRVIVDGFVVIIAALVRIISDICNLFDRKIIDGLVNAFAAIAMIIGRFSRQFQTGRLQHYLVTMLLVVITFFILTYFI